ncbi:MAG: homoserine kinase [Vicinamibacterales bacterium]
MHDAVAGREIVVPGSISNLGSGFDALSLAVQLYLRVRILDVLPDAPDTLQCQVVGRPITGENRISTAFARARAVSGVPAPGLRVEVRSDIPLRAGLGGSGAATVAGLRLYEAVTEPRAAEDWLRLGCEIEGHPDNAAAALLGGLTVSCQHADGPVTARSCAWPSEIRLVVATPHLEVATEDARRVLPESIPLRDAVFNLQHALLLVHAVRSGRPEDLREALRDRWHQAVRAPFVPGLTEALALEHPALLGACLSGSGPSVVAFTKESAVIVELLRNLYETLGVPCSVRVLAAQPPAGTAERRPNPADRQPRRPDLSGLA